MSTFGNSPAALYLDRELAKLGNKYLARKIGARIHATNFQVDEIWRSFMSGKMSSKTATHVLSLMRNEVRDSTPVYDIGNMFKEVNRIETLIDKLCRNVQIGAIKHALGEISTHGKFIKSNIKEMHRAAAWNTEGTYRFERQMNEMRNPSWNTEYFLVKDGAESMLMSKSDKRCTRQGKPHTK